MTASYEPTKHIARQIDDSKASHPFSNNYDHPLQSKGHMKQEESPHIRRKYMHPQHGTAASPFFSSLLLGML